MMHFGSAFMIPCPKAEEETLIVKNMMEKEAYSYDLDYHGNRKVKIYPNDEQDSYLMSEISDQDKNDNEDFEDEETKQNEDFKEMDVAELLEKYPEKSPIFMIGMKRRVFWVIQLMAACLFGLFINLGYTKAYQQYYLIIIPVLLIFGRE